MSNINEVYKISNFNSEQGKRFNKYKTSEPPFETYNIIEGFNPSTPNTPNTPNTGTPVPVLGVGLIEAVPSTPRNDLNAAVERYNSAKKDYPSYIDNNIFVNKNDDDIKEKRKCVPTNIRKTVPSLLGNTTQYNSHREAVAACKSIALSNSPQHNVYTIDAYGSNNNYTYTCTTHRDEGELYSTINTGDYNKHYRTLYTFKPNYKPPTKFVRSPTSQTYAKHKEICNNSNGKWTMASITSQQDYDEINTARGTDVVIIGGHRIAKRSPIWKWEDGSPWDEAIANGSKIRGCGWYTKNWIEPNDYLGPTGDEPVLIIWNIDNGSTWNDAGENAKLYAIYKEVNSNDGRISYSGVLSRDGTLGFDININSYGIIKTDRKSAVNGTDNKISLPQPIAGCSLLTGGDLNKQSINLKYKYNCPTKL